MQYARTVKYFGQNCNDSINSQHNSFVKPARHQQLLWCAVGASHGHPPAGMSGDADTLNSVLDNATLALNVTASPDTTTAGGVSSGLALTGDIALGIVLALLSLLTILGNAMVLHAVRTERALQSVSHQANVVGLHAVRTERALQSASHCANVVVLHAVRTERALQSVSYCANVVVLHAVPTQY